MTEGLFTLKEQISLLLVIGYGAGVLLLAAGTAARIVNRRKRSEKLKNISIMLLAIGASTAVLTLLYHLRINA